MTLNITDTINDAKLFGPWFSGESWDVWKAILKAAYALPLTAQERAYFQAVAEREPPTKPVREVWIIAGRRGGKDSVASVIAGQAAAPAKLRRSSIRRTSCAVASARW